jgi:hypothetical protein
MPSSVRVRFVSGRVAFRLLARARGVFRASCGRRRAELRRSGSRARETNGKEGNEHRGESESRKQRRCLWIQLSLTLWHIKHRLAFVAQLVARSSHIETMS